MQILLHATGRRVDYRKHRGLFSKNVGADRYAGDLTQLGITDGRRISIIWPWMWVGERAAMLVAGAKLRGGARGKLAGDGRKGAVGLDSTRIWVREVARDLANSTGYIGWGIGVLQGLATARGGEGSPVICVGAIPDPIRVRFSC